MGVDLALYRIRVGQFVPRTVQNVTSNIDYLHKAVLGVRRKLLKGELDQNGAVSFINLLLCSQGIEPNPGPNGREQQLSSYQESSDTDIEKTSEKNSIGIVQGVLQTVMDTGILDSAGAIGDEYEGAVAIPNLSEGAICSPKAGQSVTINLNVPSVTVQDRRRYDNTYHVKKMKMEKVDNVNTGEQNIIHMHEEDTNKPEKHSKKKSARRKNLEDAAETEILRHTEDTKNVFVKRNEAIKKATECLKNYNMVIITGVTGEGKTTLAREILRQMKDGDLDKDMKPKTPVLLDIPEEWNDVVNDKDEIVVFVDDIFGKTNYQPELLNKWKPFFDRVKHCLKENHVNLVVTSRLHILKDARHDSGLHFDSDHILSEKKMVDLTGDYKLTSEEQIDIYKNYAKVRDKTTDSALYGLPFSLYFSQPSRSIGFPQVCKMFFTNDKLFSKGEKFFLSPDDILKEDISSMKYQEPMKYFALVYCFLNDQQVEVKKLNPLKISREERQTIELYAEACGAPTTNVLNELKRAFESLSETYLTKQNTVYKFSHQSIADVVSLLFGKDQPELTLQKCPTRVILEMLRLSDDEAEDHTTLYVPPACYEALVARMSRMILNPRIYEERRFVSFIHLDNSVTLASFSKFHDQSLAECLFKHIKENLSEFLIAHAGIGLLIACANNATFLSAIYKLKVDESMIEEIGLLKFTRNVQQALQVALVKKNIESMKLLLQNGAMFTTESLALALKSEDEALIKFVMTNNIWTTSELLTDNKDASVVRDMLHKNTCNIEAVQKRYRNLRKSRSPKTSTDLQREMHDLLDKKYETLEDFVCFKRLVGHIEGAFVQRTLHRCNLDIFRFLILSTDVSKPLLTQMLSEAIHLDKVDHIEILSKVGGKPKMSDFLKKAGDVYIEDCVIRRVIDAGNWSPAELNDALDRAVSSGSVGTMKALVGEGAEFKQDALVKVSARCNDTMELCESQRHKLILSNLRGIAKLLDILFANTAADDAPPELVFVLNTFPWTPDNLSDALDSALKRGSFRTIKHLHQNGGSFRDHALTSAVGRPYKTLEVLKYVYTAENWSIQQLTDALQQALDVCRSDVIKYLSEKGAQFDDKSLKKVLQWRVEHHVGIKIIEHILHKKSWSASLLDETVNLALDTKSPAIHVLLHSSKELSNAHVLKLFEYDELKPSCLDYLLSNFQSDNRKQGECFSEILDREILQGCIDVVRQLISKGISCGKECLMIAMDNAGNYPDYNALDMVRLVRHSFQWSEDAQTVALDKAVRLGYTDVVYFLHEKGAKFSNQSLMYAMMDKPEGYDFLSLILFVMRHYQYGMVEMTKCLEKAIDIGNFQLLEMFSEKQVGFPDGSLRKVIHKRWKAMERLPAVRLVVQSRSWHGEISEALMEAVKLGDMNILTYLAKQSDGFSNQCLSVALGKSCRPSHRLCIVKLIISRSNGITNTQLQEALLTARQLSEPKLVYFIEQFIK